MAEKEDFGLDSLLNFEDSEQTPAEEPSKEKEGETKENPEVKDLKDKYEKLERSYKDQQEFLRQRNEEIKDFQDWKSKITGMDEEQKKKEIEKEIRERYNEDPLSVIYEIAGKIADEKVGKSKQEIEDLKAKNLEDKMQTIMNDIDKEYEVDWDQNATKISDQLEYFSEKAKKEKPKEVLLSACRAAGVLKPRSTEEPTHIEEGHGVYPSKAAVEKEAAKIKKGILGAKPKKII